MSIVADPHHLDADPDPAFHFDVDADPDPTFHSDADADPNPAFYFEADPDPDLDPASQNDADPYGLGSGCISGSATLPERILYHMICRR